MPMVLCPDEKPKFSYSSDNGSYFAGKYIVLKNVENVFIATFLMLTVG